LSAPSVLVLEDARACCEDERWELIPSWPHEASTCGRVRALDRIDAEGRLYLGGMLPAQPDKRPGKGYLYYDLRDGKRRRKIPAAVAVLEAHRGLRPGPGYEACHNHGVRTDNHLDKIRWDTREANLADMRRHQAERDAVAVTSLPAETPSRYRLQVRGGAVVSPRRRYGVTGAPAGNAAHGTGTSVPFLPFRPLFLFFNPVPRSLRSRRSS